MNTLKKILLGLALVSFATSCMAGNKSVTNNTGEPIIIQINDGTESIILDNGQTTGITYEGDRVEKFTVIRYYQKPPFGPGWNQWYLFNSKNYGMDFENVFNLDGNNDLDIFRSGANVRVRCGYYMDKTHRDKLYNSITGE